MKNFDIEPRVELVPAVPEPGSLTSPTQIAARGAVLLAWADSTNDLEAVRRAVAGWAAICEFVQQTSREGIAAAETTLRRLEVRVGQLLGPARVGSHHSIAIEGAQDLTADQRSQFRRMAAHPAIVDSVIQASSDADPPSRAKVLRTIATTSAATPSTSSPAAPGRKSASRHTVPDLRSPKVERLLHRTAERLTVWGLLRDLDVFQADLRDLVARHAPPIHSVATKPTPDPGPFPPGWEDLHTFIIETLEARFGPSPRNFDKESRIVREFLDRWGDRAWPIARAAFEQYGGYWVSAPISVTRFKAASDSFFSAVIAAELGLIDAGQDEAAG